jgi:thiol-disulfide isomerase/thioredoxin
MQAVASSRRLALKGLGVACLTLPRPALADQDLPPQVDEAGAAAYREFLAAGNHKAFVIAPGGAWAWKAGEASAAAALQSALRTCEDTTTQHCVAFAVDERKVFDANAWPTLWAPYPTAAQARRAPFGTARGQRFFDLAFKDPNGRATTLGARRGSVCVVHFWGSWCGPCRRELPHLQGLARRLGAARDIQWVLLQVRETIGTSRAWLRQQGLLLPLCDSGIQPDRPDLLTIADGRPIRDREIAATFPTSYVLDRHGIVLLAHRGPIEDWNEYLPFLRHAATAST